MSRRLRLALLAYPRRVRRRDGAMLLDLSRELADGGSGDGREAVGLLRGGLACRLRPLRRPGLHRGASRAAMIVMVLYSGLVGSTALVALPAGGWPGLRWLALLALTMAALIGLARRHWVVAVAASCGLMGLGVVEADSAGSTLAVFDVAVFFSAAGFGYALPVLGWAIPGLLLVPLAALTAADDLSDRPPWAAAGWAPALALATWFVTRAATLHDPSNDRLAVVLVVGAVTLAVLAGLAVTRRRRDPAWGYALALLVLAGAPLPLIAISDGLGAAAPLAALGVAGVVILAWRATAQAPPRPAA